METTQTTNGQRAGAGAADWSNVGGAERWGSVGTGLAMALFGMRRGGVPGALLVLSGGGLLLRGMTGHCYVYEMLGMSTSESETFGGGGWEEREPGSQSQAFELRATEDRISGRPVETGETEPWGGEEPGRPARE